MVKILNFEKEEGFYHDLIQTLGYSRVPVRERLLFRQLFRKSLLLEKSQF